MAFKEELIEALSQSGLEAPEFDLEESPGGKVGGFVISESFEGMPQLDRQNMLWHYLDSKFDQEKRAKIVVLVTITPTEAKAA